MMRRFGTLLTAIGLLLMAGGIGLVIYNMWDNNRAGDASDAILKQIEEAQADMGVSNAPAPPSRSDKDVDDRVTDKDAWRYGQTMPVTLVWFSVYRNTGDPQSRDPASCHGYLGL